MEALPAGLLQDVYQEALGAAVIGIDEGQFVSAWLGCVCWALRDTESSVHPMQTKVCVLCRRGWEVMPWGSLIHVACAGSQILLPYSPCRQRTVGLEPISQTGPMALIFLVPGAAVWACTMGSGAKCCPSSLFMLCLYPLQFPDIVEFCETMANAGKTVIVAALDGTFQRKVKQSFWYSSCFGTLVEPTQQHLPAVMHRPLGAS